MNKLNSRGSAAGSSRAASRRTLLLGTALASSLIALPMLTATPAQAQTTTCTGGPAAGSTPIFENVITPIVCVNNDPRVSNGSSPDAIFLQTVGGNSIFLNNSGNLTAVDDGIEAVAFGGIVFGVAANGANGIGGNADASSGDGGNASAISPGGAASATGGGGGAGGAAVGGAAMGGNAVVGGNAVAGAGGGITIINSGIIITSGDNGNGISALAFGGIGGGGGANGGVAIGGDAVANGGNGGDAYAYGAMATADGGAGGAGGASAGGAGSAGSAGVAGDGFGGVSGDISITNSANIFTSGDGANGISALAFGGFVFGGGANGGFAIGGDAVANGGNGGDAYAYAYDASASATSAATGGNGGNGGANGVGGAASGGAGGSGGDGFGGDAGNISIVNSGDIVVSGENASGIFVYSLGGGGYGGGGYGGYAFGGDANGGDGGDGGDATALANGLTANATATAGDAGDGGANGAGGAGAGGSAGIAGDGFGANGGNVSIANMGDIITSGDNASGIAAFAAGGGGSGGAAFGGSASGGNANGGNGGGGGNAGASAISSGAAIAMAMGGDGGDGAAGGVGGAASAGAGGIGGDGFGGDAGNISIVNGGNIVVSGENASGIFVSSIGGFGVGGNADGGDANGGDANGGDGVAGGGASSSSQGGAGSMGSAMAGSNGVGGAGGSGGAASGGNGGLGGDGFGGNGGDIVIVNSGGIVASGAGGHGIYAITAGGAGAGGSGAGGDAIGGDANGGVGGGMAGVAGAAAGGAGGIDGAGANGVGGSISIDNSGGVLGNLSGITAISDGGTSIVNSGFISASSLLAINVDGAAGAITNSGVVLGFIDLTDNADLFENQSGGVFQAQGTSLFGMGNDLFTNEVGGLVDTANNAGADEMVAFVGLETFENFGTISLLDGAPGDLFTISNTPGGTDLNYVAGSFLAVDAFLGGPGSRSDIFRIDGNVAGVTDVIVNNTNPGLDTFNPDGITVVQVRGNVDPSAFQLANGPIDTGFFNFDLFFDPKNGGEFNEFELRSFPGAGALLLPQLITAAQDIWHQTSDTWFDRSADLRTQLWRNGGSVAGVPGVMSLGGGSGNDGVVVEQGGLSPAVWARVSHGELEQDGSARTNAFGRSFTFNLDRELYIIDVQSGVDFALQGLMNPSDVLLLSVFGGGVSANLQYDQLDRRRFDYDGGQVGVAATYLSGGLFVDALFNAQFLEVDPNALGFAESLDSNAYGFRIDSGYRFGMGSGGLFLEPLLTLAYVNSDLDGFSFAGNTVSFQDEDSLRGRVGLRAGTSLFIENVRFEPFVIASYWGELSDDDNRATLVSSGTRFGFRDEREDGWGEVSLGTNTFLAGNNALSAFSKIDIIFGDDTEGYIAQSGFRVQW